MTGELTAVVLAGGRSRRFGDADKLLATHSGRPLIAHTVETAAVVSDTEPIVATRDASHERALDAVVDRPVRYVHDDPSLEGPLAGIAAALQITETPWLFVCGGDMPSLSAEAVEALRTRAADDGVVPVVHGRIEPLHAIYRREALASATVDAESGAGIRRICRRLQSVQRLRPSDTTAPLARSVRDIDTRTDLQRASHV